MKKFLDNSLALCEVFTFREGLLAAFGHDLRINVTSFTIEIDKNPPGIRAAFDAGSLRADCAMEGGLPRPDLLSDKDRREIDDNIIKGVLEAGKYEEIRFVSSNIGKKEPGYQVEGELVLHSATRRISFAASKEEAYYVSDVRLHLPDFGIKPFSAAWGTMRVKPDVLVRVRLPAAELEGFKKNENSP